MRLDKFQKQAIDNWDGKTVLSLHPRGSVQYHTPIGLGEMEHGAEEYECAMLKLDDLEIRRTDIHGEILSIVGRIERMSYETSEPCSTSAEED